MLDRKAHQILSHGRPQTCRRLRALHFVLRGSVSENGGMPLLETRPYVASSGSGTGTRTNDLDDSEEDGHPFTAEMMEMIMDKLLLKIRTIRTLVIMVDTWQPALVVLDKLRDCDDLPERMERFELHRTGRPWLWVGPMLRPEKTSAPVPFCDRRILYHASHTRALTVSIFGGAPYKCPICTC